MKKNGLYFVSLIRAVIDDTDTRCIGYYKKLKDAQQVILKQDLSEAGYYQYALIEKFGEGWYPTPLFEEWYLLTGDKPEKVDKPIKFDKTCNFGIG